ncbi:MAG: hypothetical protein ACREIC_31980 [Limisphaerales bacterium]
MGKPAQKREVLTVDGTEYSWEHRHGCFFETNVGLRGVSVSVCLHPAQTRELIVDFPFSEFGMKTSPKNSVLVRHLTAAIRGALSAGWEPESRGKPFRLSVADAA